jgi:hypothetical protein
MRAISIRQPFAEPLPLAAMMGLTSPQAFAMFVLVQGKHIGQLVRGSGKSCDGQFDDGFRAWTLCVHTRAVKPLVRLAYARERCVLPNGRELRGAELLHFLGHWQVKYELTRKGLRAWRSATARERWGLPEFATARADEDLTADEESSELERVECCRGDGAKLAGVDRPA